MENKPTSDDIIPKYINEEKYKLDNTENNPQIKASDNKIVDIIETRESLKDNEKTSKKIFSKWNIFKNNMDDKFRNVTKSNRTIRVMIKADYTIYPIDLPIDGKTVFFKGRRYKLDGYEHRLYEIQGIQCIFVDVNDSRPLELSHKYTNPSYDAREFCSLFDSKAINDLMAGIESEEKLDKMYYVGLITLGVSALAVVILMGWVEPDWQKIIHGIANMAQSASDVIQQSANSGTGSSTGETISGR